MFEEDEEETEEDWSKPEQYTNYDHERAGKNSLAPSQTTSCVPHGRTIVHIDIDCFYAQVEMLRNPELQDKPLGIQQKNIVVTCNYVARKYGVTKLMYIKDAIEKCPSLILVSGEDLTKYREASAKIHDFLLKYTPIVERLGFDENFLDVTDLVDIPLWKDTGKTKAFQGYMYGQEENENFTYDSCTCGCGIRLRIGAYIASEIRKAMYEELKITGCAGIAYNKLLAKLVGETHKPNKQTTLFPHKKMQLLHSLDNVKRIPGIGWTMAKRLTSIGITSIKDLQNYAFKDLAEEVGETTATNLKSLADGDDQSEVTTSGLPQSMSDEDSFKKCCDLKDARSKIDELLSSLLERLLQDGRHPQTIRLTVRKLTVVNKYSSRESRQCPIPGSLFNNFGKESMSKVKDRLMALLDDLFKKLVDLSKPFHLTLINVCFAKLETITTGIGAYFSTPNDSQKSMDTNTANKPVNSQCKLEFVSPSNSGISKSVDSCSSKKIVESPQNLKRKFESQQDSTSIKERKSIESHKTLFSPLSQARNKNQTFKPKSFFDKAYKISDSSISMNKTLCKGSTDKNVISQIPTEFDREVFMSLPEDLQKEILSQHKSTVRNDIGVDEDFTNQKNYCHSAGFMTGKNESQKGTFNNSSTTCGNEGMFISQKNKFEEVETFSRRPIQTENIPQESTSAITAFKNDKCEMGKVESSCGSALPSEIPPDIDKSVFLQLPPDIQQDLVWTWKRSKASSTKNAVNAQGKTDTTIKSPKSTNILSYFKKKD